MKLLGQRLEYVIFENITEIMENIYTIRALIWLEIKHNLGSRQCRARLVMVH